MLERTDGERTYGQYCPVAAGLDLIGDRWVLLICRELLDGPRGFNEIKHALPGLASNLLTTRLRSMTADGLVARGDDGYRLTEEGRTVIPVLRAVARFGVRALDTDPPQALDAMHTARAFLLPWVSARRMPPLAVVVHTPDGSAADIVLTGDGVRLRRHEAGDVPTGQQVVSLHVESQNLAAVRRNEAEFTGTIEGPDELRGMVLEALGLTPRSAVV